MRRRCLARSGQILWLTKGKLTGNYCVMLPTFWDSDLGDVNSYEFCDKMRPRFRSCHGTIRGRHFFGLAFTDEQYKDDAGRPIGHILALFSEVHHRSMSKDWAKIIMRALAEDCEKIYRARDDYELRAYRISPFEVDIGTDDDPCEFNELGELFPIVTDSVGDSSGEALLSADSKKKETQSGGSGCPCSNFGSVFPCNNDPKTVQWSSGRDFRGSNTLAQPEKCALAEQQPDMAIRNRSLDYGILQILLNLIEDFFSHQKDRDKKKGRHY